MFLNNLNFISVSVHKAKVYKKFSFLEFTVESPKNKFHSFPSPLCWLSPYQPLLENFPGTRAFLSYWSRWLGWKRKVRLPVEFSGLFLYFSFINPQILCLMERWKYQKEKSHELNLGYPFKVSKSCVHFWPTCHFCLRVSV